MKADGGWRLNIPAKLTVSGKRERYFFKTKDEALAEAAKLRETRNTFGEQSSAISPSLAEQATAAAALLSPFKISLLEAAQRIVSMESAKAASVTIEDALTKFETAKSGLSDKHTSAIKHMAKHLREDFTGRQISDISAEEVSKHLDARTSGPAAFNGKVRLLVTLWKWAARPPREWCKADALDHVERKTAVSGEIGTLTSKQAAILMETATKHFPDKPLETLIFEHGHAGGVEMLRKHYVGLMPKAEALQIWAIRPSSKKKTSKKITHLKIA